MNRIELIKLWIEALKSGQYKQGIRFLRKNNEYCCLGVLCELYHEHVENLEIKINDHNVYSYNNSMQTLPRAIYNYINIESHKHIHLMSLNDIGFNFKEIADKIETFLLDKV